MLGLYGVPVNHAAGLRYLHAAAAQNDPAAHAALGQVHTQGLGVTANTTKAHEHFKIAADKVRVCV